ncbi:MAG: type II secretion system F family protein [Gemmatimonadota bacterium]|nr:type II secretion system F family protein [Gemmatimonadota bacterium]
MKIRVKPDELIAVTRQLATLVNAGLPLAQCLAIVAEQAENPILRQVFSGVREDIRSGETLAGALRRYPSVFNDLYVNMVAAGEAGGILHLILDRLATFLEKSGALSRRVRGAMAYPMVMLMVACSATGIMLWKVVPVFAGIFSDAGMALPAPTRAVLALSGFIKQQWFWIIAGAGLVIAAAFRFRNTERGQLTTDRLLLRLPLIGNLARKTAISRFARTLGALINSGVSILDSLEITARAAGNRIVCAAVLESRRSIASGSTIADPLRASGVFPAMVTQMIHVGEQTGEIEVMLSRIADFYDDEIDVSVTSLTTVLEPLMIVVMGALIGGMVIAMYLPMFDLMQTMG